MFSLSREQFVPRPRDHVFAFFADARNLERLTPPSLHFQILREGPIHMQAGTVIDYRLSLSGLPFAWKTLIAEWEPPVRFVDLQTKGPYTSWRHTHTFDEMLGGTLIRDRVDYQLPLGLLGVLVHRFVVQKQLARIFLFRAQQITKLFG